MIVTIFFLLILACALGSYIEGPYVNDRPSIGEDS